MKVCCVEDATVRPVDSSCSMVLRSACNHKHSRESSVHTEKFETSHSKRNQVSEKKGVNEIHHSEDVLASKTCNGTHHLKSAEQSSLNFLSYNSDKNYTFKDRIYSNFAFTENIDHRILDTSTLNVSCSKELQFIDLSSDSSNLNFENTKEYDEFSNQLNNFNVNLNSEKVMPGSHRYKRNSTYSLRSFSGSEDDDDISVHSIRRSRRSASSIYSNSNIVDASVTQNQRNNTGSLQDESRTSESSQLDHSTLQYSAFQKFRWFLWRRAYLKVVKNVNFDVWFLSRLQQFGKREALFIFLLPLLFYLIWGIAQNASSISEVSPLDLIKSVFSSFSSFVVSVLSVFSKYFTSEESGITSTDIKETSTSDAPGKTSDGTIFSEIFNAIPSFPLWSNDKTVAESESINSPNKGHTDVSHDKEELRIMTSEFLREELEALKQLQFQENSVLLEKKENEELRGELKILQLEIQALSEVMKRMENDIKMLNTKNSNDNAFISDLKKIDALHQKVKIVETKFESLGNIKKCCDEKWSPETFFTAVEAYIAAAFRNVMEADIDPNVKYGFFNEWLKNMFLNHEKLAEEIKKVFSKQDVYNSKEGLNYDTVVKVVESFSEDHIKKIVKEALTLYDADKIGKVDFALESGGGSVLSTRCSETYMENNGKFSIFGLPLWTISNSPRTAIQPDMQPGRCWAFKGSNGFLVVSLSATIYPTGFTLEHIPVSLSPTGSVDSAPKNFSVWGLESEKDNKGVLLGKYWYDINGEPLQYFKVQTANNAAYSYVELQIHSNHGNMEYTCLYRFRVHGRRT